MYEIIADPKDYQIDHLINGTGDASVEMSREDRDKWAGEIHSFSQRLTDFSQKALEIESLLSGKEPIAATQLSLKTLKLQLFKINDAIQEAMTIASRLESDLVKK